MQPTAIPIRAVAAWLEVTRGGTCTTRQGFASRADARADLAATAAWIREHAGWTATEVDADLALCRDERGGFILAVVEAG